MQIIFFLHTYKFKRYLIKLILSYQWTFLNMFVISLLLMTLEDSKQETDVVYWL